MIKLGDSSSDEYYLDIERPLAEVNMVELGSMEMPATSSWILVPPRTRAATTLTPSVVLLDLSLRIVAQQPAWVRRVFLLALNLPLSRTTPTGGNEYLVRTATGVPRPTTITSSQRQGCGVFPEFMPDRLRPTRPLDLWIFSSLFPAGVAFARAWISTWLAMPFSGSATTYRSWLLLVDRCRW